MPRFPDFYPFFPVLRVLAGNLSGSLFFVRKIPERILGYVRFIVVDSAIFKKNRPNSCRNRALAEHYGK